MDRFMNMTSTVTNWWSGNEKKTDSKDDIDKIAAENESLKTENANDGEVKQHTVVNKSQEEESPLTSEADSLASNQSEAGESPEAEEAENAASGDEKNKAFGGIQIGINEVSTKAIESAKHFGSFLFSVANKAGKTVTETAKQLKHTVEENSILGDFNKEQEAFVKEKGQHRTEAAVPPWVGYSEEESMKQQILSLSLDRRNFLRCPPSGVQFQFDFEAMYPIALATLAEDPNLEKIRFELVPKLVNEENFWKNYFYRVSLIKQSTQLSSLAQETSSTGGDSSSMSSRKSSVEESVKGTRTSRLDDKSEDVPHISDSPTHEFVSDAYQGSVVDRDELRKGMKQLGMKDNEEEWEKEVQQELQEYEVVMDANNQNLDDAEWEKEVQKMLESELTTKDKV